MYVAPNAFKNLVNDFTDLLDGRDKARLLVHVELTLTLARQLGLEGEPVTIGWALLSRIPLQHVLLDRLTPQQRRMLANAALIVPLSSRVAWERTLARYAKEIPEKHQIYRIQPLPLDDQIIDAIYQQPSPDPQRERRYEAILLSTLSFEQRNRHETVAGETYKVRARGLDGHTHRGRVTITEDMTVDAATGHEWFDGPRPRTVISLTLDELEPTAKYLDEREHQLGEREHWVRDLRQIRFRKAVWVDGHVSLEPENAHSLHLRGMVHLPGMVSAGKTTLAKLLIAHCLRMDLDICITLVVGDSHTAIETAHQVNSWFHDDPNGADVAAVPLLGATQRETHLGRLLASREYSRAQTLGKPHWGERWLMPVCPLGAAIDWDAGEDVVMAAGSEPCEGLVDDVKDRRRKGKRHICPLFHRCPSKQLYRDMPVARVWVTTPGALAQATLPLSLDRRILKLGDLVYEQSDLVILDEVETIVDWFDRTYARREVLTSSGSGLLDRLDRQISEYWNNNRVLPSHERRWIIPAREAIKVLSSVLTAIDDPNRKRTVKTWVRKGYFSPNQLAYRLARRLAGLKEWDSVDLLPETRRLHGEMADEAFEPFNELLNRTLDPLRRQAPPLENARAADQLAGLMQAINNLSEDVTDNAIVLQCRDWLLRWYPDIEARLTTLRTQLEQSDSPYDHDYLMQHCDRSVNELAERLHFLLMVALLDRHVHIMLQEWYNKPEALEAAQPFSQIPRGMRTILPIPLTGQQYGFVIDTSSRHRRDEARNRLSLFAYTNIGRSYLLNFHRLREDLEGTPGPHVLALSGTSYLPDSTPFHVSLRPSGVLIAPRETEAAISNSRFIWRYFRDEEGEPIHVSGKDDKAHQLTLLMKAMLDDGGTPGGFLARTLRRLEGLAETHPDQWDDRARLLLLTNSYKQASAAARALRDRWPEAASGIFNLCRGRDEDYQAEGVGSGELKRIDIEQFAATGGRILIAPMQAIGRGFNILNTRQEAKAAFGAVFFLTRPLNPPHDIEAMAQELNRYALKWASDPAFVAWQAGTLYKRALNARDCAMKLRRLIIQRRGYTDLLDDAELGVYPRRDLAATTAGRIVQAVGRLLRGGVPFYAYFVDAAWSPELAKLGDPNASESEETSLLTAVIDILSEYADRDDIGKHLYGGLSEALITTENRDSN